MRHGKLIVFEGVSGTGKETQAKLLQKYLAAHHIRSQIVFHPSPRLKEILSEEEKGLFGMPGAKPAKIRVSTKEGKENT